MAKRIEPLTLGPAKRGAGKYDDLATLVRQQAGAKGVVVIVIDGPAGSGFSVQAAPALLPHLVGLLRTMADAVEADLARPETAWTCPRCGVTSHHPVDAQQRYCASCHRFADEAPLP
jgi:hypothetical protein